jgi:dimethylhistidine N-methyltransferase
MTSARFESHVRDSAARLHVFLDFEPPADDFLADALDGLSRRQKVMRPKYFYDERGSALFEAICETPEYYPTRTELRILADYGDEIAALAGPRAAIVEPGAGAAVKVRALLDRLADPALYLAIDISREHVIAAAQDLARERPGLRVGAAHADFTQPMRLPASLYEGSVRRMVFFPGSTIGNFRRPAALSILAAARGLLRRGDLLVIGVDLVKDQVTLEAAYNDADGVTAAFNLNLLARINRELRGDIHLDDFEHRAHWNPAERRIEMHLYARRDLEFTVAGRRFAMSQGESIYTEDSHKYDPESFRRLCVEAGFERLTYWTDEDRLFSVQAFEAA